MIGCNIKKLYENPNDEYDFDSAIYTAMSMDYDYWKYLMQLQANSDEKLSSLELANQLKKSFLFVEKVHGIASSISKNSSPQSDEKIYKLLSSRTFLYGGNSSCFHAKLIILRYTCENKADYYRIAVLSRNMTSDSDDQNIVIFDGFAGDKDTDNGNRLWNYLDVCGNDCKSKSTDNKANLLNFKSIKNLVSDDIEIHFNGLNNRECLYDKVFAQGIQTNDVFIVTKSFFVGKGFQEDTKFQIYSLYDQDKNTDTTHMKMYLVPDGDGYSFWSGSANCSENALGKDANATSIYGNNIECLVKIKIGKPEGELLKKELIENRKYKLLSNFPNFNPLNGYSELNVALDKVEETVTFRWDGNNVKIEISPIQISSYKIELGKITHTKSENNIKVEKKYTWGINTIGINCIVPTSNSVAMPQESSGGLIVLTVKDANNNKNICSRIIYPENSSINKIEDKELPFYDEAIKLFEEFNNKKWVDIIMNSGNRKDTIEKALYDYSLFEMYLTSGQKKSIISTLKFLKKCKGELSGSICNKTKTRGVLSVCDNPFGLKRFQMSTAKYIAECFEHGQQRFVLADEAGLGKTYVALQVIDYVRQQRNNENINVYYICSNQRIIKQNAKKIVKNLRKKYSVSWNEQCDRLSIAFKFSPTSQINLYTMSGSFFGEGFITGMNTERKYMQEEIDKLDNDGKIDQLFNSNTDVFNRYDKCEDKKNFVEEDCERILGGIGDLRESFNQYSSRKNPPHLIIIDEFHKLKNGNNEGLGYLSKLLNNKDTKMLFLSATPFKYSSVEVTNVSLPYEGDKEYKDEDEENALSSFEEYIDYFVTDLNGQNIKALKKKYDASIECLVTQKNHQSWKDCEISAKKLSSELKKFMCRAERGRISESLYLEDYENSYTNIEDDFNVLQYLDIASKGAYGRLIPGFDSYKLRYYDKKTLNQYSDSKQTGIFLWKENNGNVEMDSLPNPYIEMIWKEVVEDLKGVLWLPPTKPYYYADENSVFKKKNMSKLLVFSNFHFLPRAVSSIISRRVEEELGHKKVNISLQERDLDKITRYAQSWDFSSTKETLYLDTIKDMIEDYEIVLGHPQVCLYRILPKVREDTITVLAVHIFDRINNYLERKVSNDVTPYWEDYLFYCNKKSFTNDGVKLAQNAEKRTDDDEKKDWIVYYLYHYGVKRLNRDTGDLFNYNKKAFVEQVVDNLKKKCKTLWCQNNQWKIITDYVEMNRAICEIKSVIKKSISSWHKTILDEVLNWFNSYFSKDYSQRLFGNLNIKNEEELLIYCANGNMQAMLEELLFVCNNDWSSFLDKLNNSLNLQNSKVHILTDNAEPTDLSDELKVTCGFAERFTEDMSDTNERSSIRQIKMQEAFNSPFWPMILTTTSIAQEGLDFHCYCRKIMHYTLPTTPMALEQREGRVDRHCGYIQRIRMAQSNNCPNVSWIDLFSESKDENGMIPAWIVPKKYEDISVERLLPYLPNSDEMKRYNMLLSAKHLYRSILGMPNEVKKAEKLIAIAQMLGNDLNDIFPDLTC